MERITAIEAVKRLIDKNEEDKVIQVFVEKQICPPDFGLQSYQNCLIATYMASRRAEEHETCRECWHEVRVLVPDKVKSDEIVCANCWDTGLVKIEGKEYACGCSIGTSFDELEEELAKMRTQLTELDKQITRMEKQAQALGLS